MSKWDDQTAHEEAHKQLARMRIPDDDPGWRNGVWLGVNDAGGLEFAIRGDVLKSVYMDQPPRCPECGADSGGGLCEGCRRSLR